MLPEEEKNINKEAQSEQLLTQEKLYEIPLWKRITMFVIGLIGIHIIGLIVSFAVLSLPKEQQNSIVNLVSYAVLFVALVSVILFDLPKLLYQFKKWTNYLIGFGFGVAIVAFDMIYSNILNLFYTYQVSDNETSVRSVIELYPLASLLMLGVIGPICEELTYRVGLFSSVKKLNKILAYIITVLVFAFIHFGFTSSTIWNEVANLPVYLASGFVLTLAYDKFGFSASSVAHITNNLWAIGAQIILKKLGA